jgi:hypothetical protein
MLPISIPSATPLLGVLSPVRSILLHPDDTEWLGSPPFSCRAPVWRVSDVAQTYGPRQAVYWRVFFDAVRIVFPHVGLTGFLATFIVYGFLYLDYALSIAGAIR